MIRKNALSTLTLILLSYTLLQGQNEPVILEAESGSLGADFITGTEGDVDYITCQTDLAQNNPGNDDRVITFDVTFPNSGTYSLFGRLKVGTANYNDDSYFYANGFGVKNAASDADWILANGLAAAGFTEPTDVVSGTGGAPNNVWKWVNFADFDGGESPITFTVEAGSLNQTFQIGGREDGLLIDKLAFARSDYYYTVSNLDNGEPGSSEPPASFVPEGPPIADGQEKFIGCVYSTPQLPYFEMYWNQVTPENAGKWASVESTRDQMNWGELDNAYNLAKDNDFFYRHHVLVWGNQQPTWMAALDSAEQYNEISEWFSELANRYDSIDQVEVVNEPLHDPPDDPEDGGYIGALGGEGVTGWDWIINAFRLARTHFPETDLMINEYSIVNDFSSLETYLEIIELLQAEDTLIDAIGIQCHAFSTGTSSDNIIRTLDSLEATGLPVYITELDIDGLTDERQIREYQRLFPIFWEHTGVKGITLWGYRPGMWRTSYGANLVNNDNTERPALLWLRAYIQGNFAEVESVTVSTDEGTTEINTDNGTLQMLAEIFPDTATVKDVVWSVNNTNIAKIDMDGLLTAVDNGTVTVTAKAIDGSAEEGTLDIDISNQVLGVIRNTNPGMQVLVYPNPAENGSFTIQNTDHIKQINILDVSGHQINIYKLNNQSSIDLHLDIAPGIYFIRLDDGKNVLYEKIVIH